MRLSYSKDSGSEGLNKGSHFVDDATAGSVMKTPIRDTKSPKLKVATRVDPLCVWGGMKYVCKISLPPNPEKNM